MNRSGDTGLAGPGIMLFSVALFGYFGFVVQWSVTHPLTGQFVFFFALLAWTIKIAAVLFLVSAIVTFVKPWTGNLLYSLTGLLSAISFLVVLTLDLMDPNLGAALGPFWLALFAAWNGYGAFTGLRAVLSRPPMTDTPTA